MQARTAMGAAFHRAGGPDPVELALGLALTRFRNNGGSYERALEIVRTAFADELPSEGPPSHAVEGPRSYADARPTDRVEEAHPTPPQGRSEPANSTRLDREPGEALATVPTGRQSVAKPVREPSVVDITARRVVAQQTARVILKIDDRDVRDWTFGEARKAAKSKSLESYVLASLAHRYKASARDHDRIGQYATDEVIAEVIREGRRFADDAA